jgi:hypothetical protein
MEEPIKKSWFKKKRYIIPLAVVGIVAIANTGGNSNTTTQSSTVPTAQVQGATYTPAVEKVVQDNPVAPVTDSEPVLSNDNYYTNVNGNDVHSPAYSNSVPSDASAVCGDGTYSFSQNRRGTCSHHGGVAEWLY